MLVKWSLQPASRTKICRLRLLVQPAGPLSVSVTSEIATPAEVLTRRPQKGYSLPGHNGWANVTVGIWRQDTEPKDREIVIVTDAFEAESGGGYIGQASSANLLGE